MRPATCFYWTARSCFATDAGGRRTILVRGPKTKANRELALSRLGHVLAKRDTQVAAPDTITVAEIIDLFLANSEARLAAGELKPNTVNNSYKPYGSLVRQECGSWRANNIADDQVLNYRRDLIARKLSPTTIQNRLAMLRRVLRWAKQKRLIYQVVRISPGSARRREHIPTREELDDLIANARPDVRDVLVMLMHCPVRPGDCFALRCSWVDIDKGLIRMPDSKRGQRLVPLGNIPVVTKLLRRRLDQVSGGEGFVFTTITGRPWRFRYFGEQVRRARVKAGLGAHIVAYALRHFFTTNALLNGVPLETVGALRGDRHLATTMIYAHLSEHLSHLQQAARQAVGLTDEVDE